MTHRSLSTRTHTFHTTYDPNGNLLNKTDARGIVADYVYDQLNRVTNRNYSTPNGTPPNYQATPNVTYTYGTTAPAIGKLVKVESSVSTTDYLSFDILGRVTRSKQTTDGVEYGGGADPTRWMTYRYNLAGALVEQQYPSGRVVKNVLDGNGDLEIVRSKKDANHGFWNYAQNFTYSAAGAVNSMQLGNGRWESTVFNSRLQPTRIALGTTVNATDLLKLDYDYGDWTAGGTVDPAKNNGNIVQQTITVPNSPGQTDAFTATQKYHYDPLNRIDGATEEVNNSQTWRQDFSFDRYGNRSLVEANTTTIPRNCGTAPNLTVCAADQRKYNPSIDVSNNRLSTADGYSFDPAGNTTGDPDDRTFIYDGENKQVEVRDTSNNVVGQYLYNGDGQRVKKIVPATGEVTVFVHDAAGKQIAEYSTVVAPTSTAKVNYLTNDHLGSPRINTDQTGAVTSRHDYRPFGEEVVTSKRSENVEYGNDTIRKKFTGVDRDDETGLDAFGARLYSSVLGRFMAADPLISSGATSKPQSWNRYLYTRNNPLNLIDVLGLYTFGEGATGDSEEAQQRRENFRQWHTGIKTALAYFQKDPLKYSKQIKKIEKVLAALGEEGKVGKAGIDIKIKFKEVTSRDANAVAEPTAAFNRGRLVSSTYSISFDPRHMAQIDESILAHETQHIVDFKDALDHTSISNGTLVIGGQYNLNSYQREERAIETAQYVLRGVGKDDNSHGIYETYRTSWASADEKTIEANMKSSRDLWLLKGYGYIEAIGKYYGQGANSRYSDDFLPNRRR